jgi:8-oxo-dGTP pyrophosphatase MutT (NUDIX family)
MPHLHYAFDFVVGAFLVDPLEGRVLLIHHRKLNCWLCPGGHIELHEDPEQAIHREVYEETGLVVKLHGDRGFPYQPGWATSLIPPRWLDVHPITATHSHICFYWPALVEDGILTFNQEEHLSPPRWFSADELATLEPLWPATRFYAQESLHLLTMQPPKV